MAVVQGMTWILYLIVNVAKMVCVCAYTHRHRHTHVSVCVKHTMCLASQHSGPGQTWGEIINKKINREEMTNSKTVKG